MARQCRKSEIAGGIMMLMMLMMLISRARAADDVRSSLAAGSWCQTAARQSDALQVPESGLVHNQVTQTDVSWQLAAPQPGHALSAPP